MQEVNGCVTKTKEIFIALEKGDKKLVGKLAKEISKQEARADTTKNELRNHLPGGLFMPISKSALLEILSLQDDIADDCEDIGILLTLKELTLKDIFKDDFKNFLDKNIETFELVKIIIEDFDNLLETSFAGREAERVKSMVQEVALREHEADLSQRQLLKNIFSNEDQFTHGELQLWLLILKEIRTLSNTSEKLAHRIRNLLDLE
ncbi:phosphate transport regulator [Candidatus Scalindua japonica]|uniref:Phosphate transport regulator n=2 Tax=Candidatus Scalindua japonica TaxID=1284222 RepID=A0A286TUT5_9BACT|nr:phosphate transport regulator [Candidatus Scalindua japonica]